MQLIATRMWYKLQQRHGSNCNREFSSEFASFYFEKKISNMFCMFSFCQESTIPAVLVPRVRQQFSTKNDAYIFYKDYAKLAGFSLRIVRTSKETNHWVCNREGKHESKNKEEEAKTEKGSRRCGCPAYVKVKKDGKHNFWFFDHVQEAHNHKLEPSPRMTRYKHAHKNMAEGMSDLFNIMTRNGVPHQAALNVMADLYDGRHMWGFTEKDIKNMYVLNFFSLNCNMSHI